ncbi:MAG: sulfotransferase family protein [Pirellulales bacterium]
MATVTSPPRADKSKKSPAYKDRPWIPRFWDGMNFSAWLRILSRARFIVHWQCIGMAFMITLFSAANSLLGYLQTLIYGRRVARTEIKQPPIFILGHWRSGTTYLHELLILDERHTYPTTLECFAPHHFLLSEWFISRWLRFLAPARRPMDNVAVGWDRPQEDEFALCNMGLPSPYLTMAFPNGGFQDQDYLDFHGVAPEARARWKQKLLWFLKQVTFRKPKRIVLKSPPHTARIKLLLELFPDARFVHIVRDPYAIFPSTVNLWKSLYREQGLQSPRFEGLEDHVFETFNRMYASFDQERDLLGPGQFCEVRYEELVRDPVGQMRAIYDALELGEFDKALPAIEAYAANVADYQTNRFKLAPETRAEISRRWGEFIEKYGYANGQ